MAEFDNLTLTAGHDLHSVSSPLQADTSRDGDHYVTLSAKPAQLRAGTCSCATAKASSQASFAAPTSAGPSPLAPATCASPSTPAGIDRTIVSRELRAASGPP
jgi:hypothetical protein